MKILAAAAGSAIFFGLATRGRRRALIPWWLTRGSRTSWANSEFRYESSGRC